MDLETLIEICGEQVVDISPRKREDVEKFKRRAFLAIREMSEEKREMKRREAEEALRKGCVLGIYVFLVHCSYNENEYPLSCGERR